MKKISFKDIFLLLLSVAVIGTSIFFILRTLNPPKKKNSKKAPADKIVSVSSKIDEGTFNRIDNLSDYGKPTLDGLGRENIFADTDKSILFNVIEEKNTKKTEEANQNTTPKSSVVCDYTENTDGTQSLPSECNNVADGRTITK